MTSENSRLIIKEELAVEDWEGDDSDARQAAGEPPDRITNITTWYKGGREITDPDEIKRVEAEFKERENASS